MKYFSGVIYRLVLISKDGSSRLSDVKDINGKNLMQVSMRKILCKFQWGKLEISCLAVTVPWEVRMWFHAIENALQPPHPPHPHPETQYVENRFLALFHFYFIQTLVNARCVMLIENQCCFPFIHPIFMFVRLN